MIKYACAVIGLLIGMVTGWFLFPLQRFPLRADPAATKMVLHAQTKSALNLEAFRSVMALAPPDTVRTIAYRYIRRHDTAWLRDTVTRDSVVEAVRWLTLSDSSQRVRCDSLAGELSLVAPARALSSLTVGLLAVADADGIRPGLVVERSAGWARIGGGLLMDPGLRRPGLVGMVSLDF